MVDQTARWKAEAQKVLDVRPELESGGEPFVRIMEAASVISPGGSLVIIAPFEPISLYDVLVTIRFSRSMVGSGTADPPCARHHRLAQ